MLLHTGLDLTSVHITEWAYILLARRLYDFSPPPETPVNNAIPKKIGRNEEICQRYEAGETMAELAKVYGISEQRVHQIIHGT